VMYFYFNNNETIEYIDDDYRKIYFTKSKMSFETKSHHKLVMAGLINEKVITSDWQIDASKVADFVAKYDEEISGRTLR
jgi:hypothetical protein